VVIGQGPLRCGQQISSTIKHNKGLGVVNWPAKEREIAYQHGSGLGDKTRG